MWVEDDRGCREGKGCDVTVYRQDFSEEVSRVNKARKEHKTEKI